MPSLLLLAPAHSDGMAPAHHLERHFGARLFTVRQRRVNLTAEGEALFAYTERVFNLLRKAERAGAATRGLERGELKLGASRTIGIYLLRPVLVRFAAQYPVVGVAVSIGTTADVVARVLADEMPFGLVEAAVHHPELDVRPFATDEMVLIVPPEHSWTQGAALPVEALRGTVILRRDPGSGTRAFVDGTLERAGLTPETATMLGRAEALKQAILAGGGGLGAANHRAARAHCRDVGCRTRAGARSTAQLADRQPTRRAVRAGGHGAPGC
jgi:DNA-binding transcriptional LysR family regulator